ncbi:MAG: exonuclease SbcCD subunit D [Pseudomonadota bacterium]
MRFIHTADWHLGRLFHGVHLTEDQALVLDQIHDLMKSADADALIVAGDVYDRAVPPVDAVRLLDDFLSRVGIGLGKQVVMIAGNHDSPDRLGFGSRVLAQGGLHMISAVDQAIPCITLKDGHGPVKVYALPFTEPSVLNEKIEGLAARDHQGVMTALVQRVWDNHPKGARSLLTAHAFVIDCEETESERPLSLGGADRVAASCLDGFDYVALGHLHKPQRAGSETVRYSGSLLKYSFGETQQEKVVLVVDMDERGDCRIEAVPIKPRRDVRRIEGHMKELLERPGEFGNTDDYLLVRLLDKGAILDVMRKLRDVFPNALHVERPHLEIKGRTGGAEEDPRGKSDSRLFGDFFFEVTGEPLSDAQRTAYESIAHRLRVEDRETAA